MPAIISDQFRVMNSETFIKSLVSIGNTSNNYYIFIGQPNCLNVNAGGSPNWGTGIPPLDSFEEENAIKDTIIAMKKVTGNDIRRVIRKINWEAGKTFEMYKHNYNIYNLTPNTNVASLYNSNFYVINDNLRVYVCLYNGSNPENRRGTPSIDEPDFVDLESRPAGASGDGYIWKYLYTIKPSEIIKFDSIEYIPVPENWGTEGESISIKNNSIDGKIEIISILDRGTNYGPINDPVFTNIPILGDGTGGRATITIDSFGRVSDIFVTEGGTGYTRGFIDFKPGALGIPQRLSNTGTLSRFEVIIPPKGGHGQDIYRELGAYRVLIYSRFETLSSDPDVILGNDFARIGIIKNPTVSGSNFELLTKSQVSGLQSLKLVGTGSSLVTYAVDSTIIQNVSTGVTAIGFVASWDNITGVLKYYQPVGLATEGVNYNIIGFGTNIGVGGETTVFGAAPGSVNLRIDTSFSGVSTVINSRTYQLGSNFISGISSAEFNKKSGEIIYIDNRTPIPRSASQKEDIKIVLEF